MSKTTNLSVEKIIKKAKNYFDGTFGLKLVDETAGCCLDFRSDLGFVTIQIVNEKQKREVNLSTREYEHQIQDFLQKL